MFLFLFALLFQEGGETSVPYITETEIFQVADLSEVEVRADGSLYLLNYDQAQVQYYGPDGQLKKKIGRRGKGPGEFTYPSYMALRGSSLYVFDLLNAKISTFTAEGEFVSEVKLPSREVVLQRGVSGLMSFAKSSEPRGGASELIWTDDQAKTKTVAAIPNTGWGSGTWITIPNGKLSITYSPLSALSKLITNKGGSKIYYSDPITFKIKIFDGKSGSLLSTISREDKPIPFDTDWADTLYQEKTEGTRKQNPGEKIQKLYPEYFPSIRSILFDPDGNLVVDRWRGKPDEKHYIVAYDSNGKEVQCKYDWEVLARCVGRVKDTLFLSVFESEGELGFVKVEAPQANAYAAAHPVTDWARSRMIMLDE